MPPGPRREAELEALFGNAFEAGLVTTGHRPIRGAGRRNSGRLARKTSPTPTADRGRIVHDISGSGRPHPALQSREARPDRRGRRVPAHTASATWATANLHYNVFPDAGQKPRRPRTAIPARDAIKRAVPRPGARALAARSPPNTASGGSRSPTLRTLRRPRQAARHARDQRAALDPNRGILNPGSGVAGALGPRHRPASFPHSSRVRSAILGEHHLRHGERVAPRQPRSMPLGLLGPGQIPPPSRPAIVAGRHPGMRGDEEPAVIYGIRSTRSG